jgi:DGQHR domain-containing protein
MLATQIQQKDSSFYFVPYPAQDLLPRVQFMRRYYGEGEAIVGEPRGDDEISQFIGKIERSDKAFQRDLSRAKVRSILNFYEAAITQPPIPGAILLFTPERLTFEPLGQYQSVGNLTEPSGKYLIIDGQHRLAALHFYLKKNPHEGMRIRVPCVIFDGKSEDFAVEMFVIINSTPTRINKSHLVDLYEKIQWIDPKKRFASRLVDRLYRETDSPLRYRINRLGGRSRKDKWILQAELFNELHRWVEGDPKVGEGRTDAVLDQYYTLIRDYLKGCEKVFEGAWGNNERYMVTHAVVLKALIRLLRELSRDKNWWQEEGRVERFVKKLSPLKNNLSLFSRDLFYEKFPAEGHVERIKVVLRKLREIVG